MNRQGAAAADGGAQAAAHQLLTHLRPEHAAGQAMQRPAQQRTGRRQQPAAGGLGSEGAIRRHPPRQAVIAAEAEGGTQQLLPRGRHRRQGILKAPQQCLPQARHADQIVRPHPLQIGAQLFERGVSLRAATGQQEIFSAALVGMPDRQHAEHAVARLRCHGHAQVAQLVQQVGVAEGNALGLAGGARGVKHRGQTLFTALRPGRCRRLGPGGHQFVPGVTRQHRHHGAALTLQQHHEAKLPQQLTAQLQAGEQLGRLEHQRHGTGISGDVAQLLHRGSAAAHGIRRTEAHQALIRHQPARTVLREQRHHLPRLHAQSGETSSGLLDPGMQIPETQLLRRLGVGGIQSGGISVALGQPAPELLQAAEIAPVGPLSQGLLIAAAAAPADLRHLHGLSDPAQQKGGTGLTTPAALPGGWEAEAAGRSGD